MPHRDRCEKLEYRLSDVACGTHNQVCSFTLCLQPADTEYLKDEYQYTYKFKPAPSRDDPVIGCIREAITQLNGDPEPGIRMCNHNFRVRASATAPTIWPPSLTNGDVKFYTFLQDEQEFPLTAPVSVFPREGPLTVDTVFVREGGNWISIKDWLLKIGDDSILQKRSACSIEYFWRKRDPNKFRLMDLPTGLRLMILERVIAPEGEIYPLSKALKAQRRPDLTTAGRQNAHLSLSIGYDVIPHIRDGALSYISGEDSDDPLEHQKRISPPNLVL
jgi:hypothetical protein